MNIVCSLFFKPKLNSVSTSFYHFSSTSIHRGSRVNDWVQSFDGGIKSL